MQKRTLSDRERCVRSIRLADDDWTNGRDNVDHLTTILVINGTFHHLEAIRICEAEDGRQHAASPEFEESVDGMFQIGGEGPFDTVSIKGDSYVLVVIPFQ